MEYEKKHQQNSTPRQHNRRGRNMVSQFRDSHHQVEQDHLLFPQQRQENNTGIPTNLKTGFENYTGYSLDHIFVHYNSEKPATFQAEAYAQNNHVYLAPGQEKHLPHELGHVIQQMQGKVQATTSVDGMAVNDNAGLEYEATLMGNMALRGTSQLDDGVVDKSMTLTPSVAISSKKSSNQPIQRKMIVDTLTPIKFEFKQHLYSDYTLKSMVSIIGRDDVWFHYPSLSIALAEPWKAHTTTVGQLEGDHPGCRYDSNSDFFEELKTVVDGRKKLLDYLSLYESLGHLENDKKTVQGFLEIALDNELYSPIADMLISYLNDDIRASAILPLESNSDNANERTELQGPKLKRQDKLMASRKTTMTTETEALWRYHCMAYKDFEDDGKTLTRLTPLDSIPMTCAVGAEMKDNAILLDRLINTNQSVLKEAESTATSTKIHGIVETTLSMAKFAVTIGENQVSSYISLVLTAIEIGTELLEIIYKKPFDYEQFAVWAIKLIAQVAIVYAMLMTKPFYTLVGHDILNKWCRAALGAMHGIIMIGVGTLRYHLAGETYKTTSGTAISEVKKSNLEYLEKFLTLEEKHGGSLMTWESSVTDVRYINLPQKNSHKVGYGELDVNEMFNV